MVCDLCPPMGETSRATLQPGGIWPVVQSAGWDEEPEVVERKGFLRAFKP